MKRLFMILLSLALVLSACAQATPSPTTAPEPTLESTPIIDSAIPTAAPRTLTVFAAASLTDAFGEIAKSFEAANPGITVKLNFGGSQTLRTQIEQGAATDIFASASGKEMDALIASEIIAEGMPKTFVTNQLVVIMPAKNPAGLKTLDDLAKSGIKLVLAAKEVPVGNYSLQVLDKLEAANAGYKDKVLANVVSYENDVKQVVAKVQLGEADAGIVYLSDAVAAPELQKINIPAESNVIAQYPIVVLLSSPKADLALLFIDHVFSPQGQATLKKWGFVPVQ